MPARKTRGPIPAIPSSDLPLQNQSSAEQHPQPVVRIVRALSEDAGLNAKVQTRQVWPSWGPCLQKQATPLQQQAATHRPKENESPHRPTSNLWLGAQHQDLNQSLQRFQGEHEPSKFLWHQTQCSRVQCDHAYFEHHEPALKPPK